MADAGKTDLGWVVLELMGHRKMGGYVREQEIAGKGFLRIDVPDITADENGPWTATQFYSPDAVYCVTPTTKEIAVGLAVSCQPAPVSRYELPAAKVEQHHPNSGVARSPADEFDDDFGTSHDDDENTP